MTTNNVTVKAAYPLPKNDETLDSLTGAKIVTSQKLHLSQGKVVFKLEFCLLVYVMHLQHLKVNGSCDCWSAMGNLFDLFRWHNYI